MTKQSTKSTAKRGLVRFDAGRTVVAASSEGSVPES